ncbi:MAG: pantetheine-phosphate adenylyltransferase [Lentisphaerae bacterium]|nr:MAG: pantetheine-phosphate adenylyltransferase [Lentisphaerota bacterium]
MPDKRAVYAFSGDPITYGHVDIVQRVASTYTYVCVAIGDNPEKAGRYLFSREERLAMTQKALAHLPNVECTIMEGLLAEYAFRHAFDVIVRGVRNNSDLEAELSFFAVNTSLHPSLDTILIPARPQLSHISSSVVKALVLEGGDVSKFCPLFVKQKLERKLLGKLFIGIAGGIAAGKSTIGRMLQQKISEKVEATLLSLDTIGHEILGDSSEILYQKTRQSIIRTFGSEVANPDGTINRTRLGQIVFADAAALQRLNAIMRDPMLARLYEHIRRSQAGIVLLEGAILVEANWTQLVNNNVILVDAPVPQRLQRIVDRNHIPREEALRKIERQPDHAQRVQMLQEKISHAGWGHCWECDNSDGRAEMEVSKIASEIIHLWETDPPR